MGGRPDPRHAPWPQYASAVVELVIDGRHLVLTPLPPVPPGERPGDRADPSAGTHAASVGQGGGSLAAIGPPIWVLTAGDPYPAELTEQENAERGRRLMVELDAAGVLHDPALGRSPDGATYEVSRALRGIDRVRAISIAARYDQLAVYEIDDSIRCVDVATGQVVTSRPFTVAEVDAGSDRLGGPTGWRG
jgi:hypothetical protein